MKIILVLLLVCMSMHPYIIFAQSAVIDKRATFQEMNNEELQAALSQRLNKNSKWRSLIASKRMGVCVVDLNQQPPRVAAVNGDHMMYAASLPKIAILLAAYVSIEDGSLELTPKVKKDLVDMIRVSSNSAATRMIDRVGMKNLQAILQDPRYQFYDKTKGGGIWVGKRFASAGKRLGDPLYNISHGATANQVCRFFYELDAKQLVTEERSEQMLENLSKPLLHHKFVSQTDALAPRAAVYRKSGSWKRWHADAIMVKGVRWRNYILVGLVESKDGEKIIRELLHSVESVIRPNTILSQ